MYWGGCTFRGNLNDREGSGGARRDSGKAFYFSYLWVSHSEMGTEILKEMRGLDVPAGLPHEKCLFCEVCPVTLTTFTEGSGHWVEPIT